MNQTRIAETTGSEWKLKFCPHCLNVIKDTRDLAHELVYVKKNSDPDLIEKELGFDFQLERNYLKRNDKRESEYFGEKIPKERDVLLEKDENNLEENGLEILRKLVESSDVLKEGPPEEEGDERHHFWAKKGSKQKIMYTRPCCPICHCRFPAGWSKAEDFGAVLLMAPTGGGKTSYMHSLMCYRWDALKSQFASFKFDGAGGKHINIMPAYFPDDEEYEERRKKAEEIATERVCPEPTPKEDWIYPVFLKVRYDNHRMILGIYDNAGEKLMKQDLDRNQDLRIIASEKVIADLFLFDPEHLYIDGVARDQKSNSDNKWFDQCKVLSIGEQAALQSKSKKKTKLAEEKIFGKRRIRRSPINTI